jgi:hypothetical protein
MLPVFFCRKFHASQKRFSAFFSYLVPFELRSPEKGKKINSESFNNVFLIVIFNNM